MSSTSGAFGHPGPAASVALRRIAEVVRGATVSDGSADLAWDDGRYWNSEASRTARCQYLAVGNAINFRFWRVENSELIPMAGRVEGELLRGSMFMWRCLRRATLDGGLSLTAESLAAIGESDVRRVFTDDDGRCPLEPALQERVRNLQDLGRRLGRDWGGHFEAVVDSVQGSLRLFEEASARFRAFDDPLRKLTRLNAIMLQGSGLVEFDAPLMPAIDYHLVKQAVRQGLVVPDSMTASKLRSGEFLSERQSLRLRSEVLAALIAVAEEAGISGSTLDNLYWLNRQVCDDNEPQCEECVFLSACARKVEFRIPLEETRYY